MPRPKGSKNKKERKPYSQAERQRRSDAYHRRREQQSQPAQPPQQQQQQQQPPRIRSFAPSQSQVSAFLNPLLKTKAPVRDSSSSSGGSRRNEYENDEVDVDSDDEYDEEVEEASSSSSSSTITSSSSSSSSSSKRRKTAAYENEEGMPEEKEEGQQPAAVNPPDVHANLDDEAQVDDDNNGPGVMKELLRAVHARLKKETHKDFTEERWLLGISKSNDWWLRVERLEVDKVFERLQIQPSLMEYFVIVKLIISFVLIISSLSSCRTTPAPTSSVSFGSCRSSSDFYCRGD